ncbi:hypothetical protein CANCADRAFT_15993, partial [Tortispora caseinolytica NRRL Y-17796]
IGRHNSCDFVVNSPSVSNMHCCLEPVSTSAGHFFVVLKDHSANGTIVDGHKVPRESWIRLFSGSCIRISKSDEFIFNYPSADTNGAFKANFALAATLGSGTHAEVKTAVCRTTLQPYAVKIFHKRPVNQFKAKSSIDVMNEVHDLAVVKHRNILRIFSYFEEPEDRFLVLELAAGGDLFEYITAKKTLSEKETRAVLFQIAAGLQCLHSHKIIHRDIKPENILLMKPGSVTHIKLADFEMAKIIGEKSFTTTLCGTPSYVAPEIIDPGDRKYSYQVDIWSTGVVTYLCLFGHLPFSENNNIAPLAHQIRNGLVVFPEKANSVPCSLISSMLKVDPKSRITVEKIMQHVW